MAERIESLTDHHSDTVERWNRTMRSIGYDLDKPIGEADFPERSLFPLRDLARSWLFVLSGLVLLAGCLVCTFFHTRQVLLGRASRRAP